MIKTILVIILIILLFFFIFNNVENFVGVKLVNDFYVSENINVNINDKSINTNKICIFKRDTTTKEIIDHECIDANELISTLKLPKSRKDRVCLDGNCLNKSDIQLLLGQESVNILNKFQYKNFKNTCIGGNHAVKLKRCGASTKISWLPQFVNNWWINSSILSSSPKDCNTSDAWSFKFILGDNLDKNLKRNNVAEQSDAGEASPIIGHRVGHD